MTEREIQALQIGDRVTTRIGSESVLCAVVSRAWRTGRELSWRIPLRRVVPVKACVTFERRAIEIALASRYDPLTANVFADWLEENGEIRAAAKLRAVFPLAPAVEGERIP